MIELDNALVWRARMDIPEAWEKLHKTFEPVFVRLAWKLADSPHEWPERQDLVAEGMLALTEHVRNWDGEKPFAASLIVKARGFMSEHYSSLFQKGPVVPKKTLQRVRKVERLVREGKTLGEAVSEYNKNVPEKERITMKTMVAALNSMYTKEVTEYE